MRFFFAFAAAATLAACSNDTFVSSDAGGDGGVALEAAPPGDAQQGDACVGTPLTCTQGACDDFESGIGAFTPNAQNTATGTVSVTSSQFVSCSHALQVDLEATQATLGRAQASFDKVGIVQSTATVTVDLWIWLPLEPGAYAALAVRAGPDMVSIHRTSATEWRLSDTASSSDVVIDPLLHQWNHMTLKITFTNSVGDVSLAYTMSNGTTTSTGFNDKTLESGGSIDDIGLDLGFFGTGTNEKMTGYYDNVAFNVQ